MRGRYQVDVLAVDIDQPQGEAQIVLTLDVGLNLNALDSPQIVGTSNRLAVGKHPQGRLIDALLFAPT